MQEKFIHWLNQSSEDFQFVLFGVILSLLIFIEIIQPLRKSSNRKGRWPSNFSITFVNVLILGMLPVSFFSAATYAEKSGYGILNQIHLSFFWILGSTLLLRGFISFITHYLQHKIPLFWRFHRVHHLDTEFDVSTTVRFHPLEFVVNLLLGIPLIVVLGLSSWALLLYDLMDVVVTIFSHANISLPKKVERILRYIIVTPDLHRVHHSSYQPETDSNYSAVFPIWDLIFSTFKTNSRAIQSEMELGLEEVRDKKTTNFWWLMISPFVRFKKR